MNCDELVELITEYLDNSLSPVKRATLEAHLLECDGCVNYLNQYKSTVSILSQIPQDGPSAALRERLLAGFRERQR